MEKRVIATLINVAAHPHSGSQTYQQLFELAYSQDVAIRVRGDRYAWMSHLWINENKGEVFLTGNIATFTQIDMDGAWIDMGTRLPADKDRLSTIKQAVKGVQPNYHEFRFHVDLQSHQVAVETHDGERSLSPKMTEKYFRDLFARENVIEQFGEVEVHYVADKEALNHIIGSKYLRKIEIHITRPNADGLADVERAIMEELGLLGAKGSTLTYTAIRGQALTLTDDIKDIARVARKNGYVEGNVGGESYSTKDHPLEKAYTFDDDAQTQESAFTLLARELFAAEANSAD
ncbi:hypothetical protein FHR51_000387 [Xanthomonas arboricola]|uniref:DUF4747 family protein n=1 Tax=Xanthomonas cannabis TaxID=1885674 RepID=UPI001608232C|nr:DUF4747 family protein [Xanthomonas cannabis]MBB3804276.1 hypothetical protein [Xanthomonas cannabis]